jgi:NAD(P)-dependent dehydrogenase (short-subunit alcohol dehydrogenase family)
MRDSDLKGTSALVTGGASGLGAGTVRKLTALGVRCTIFDRDEGGAKALAEEVGAEYVAGDVTDPGDCQRAVDHAAGVAQLRITVNCAGTAKASRVIDRDNSTHDLGVFKLIQELNVVGTFNVMTRAASAMAVTQPLSDGERGVIVNTASVAAFDGQVGQLAYAASKGAVVAMTLPAARDLASVGIRVVTIAPGLFETPLLATLSEEQRQALARSVLFPKKLGQAAQFGELVAHVAQNGYLNGEVIRLDGGIRMPPK